MTLRRSADRDTDTVAPGTPIVPVATDLGSVARDYFRNWDPGRRRTRAEIAASIQKTYLVCFEAGKHYRILSRHLRLYGLRPDDYRKKWGLPDDYPMLAAADRDHRSRLTVERKLGKYDRSNSKPRGPYVIKSKLPGGNGPAKAMEPSQGRPGGGGATKSTEGSRLIATAP